MKHCIVEDSSFVAAVMDQNDVFHKDALFIFQELSKRNDKLKIVIPPLAIYEVVITLKKKGVPHNTIVNKIVNLIHIDNVLVNSINEISAFKHCKSLLNSNNGLRTHDFMIVSIAIDHEAQILTFDKAMWQKVRPLYNKIYYCSCEGSMLDETSIFLTDLDSFA